MSHAQTVYEIVREHISSPDHVFVFPSEITARFWRAEAVRRGPRRAVREERFISWDTFKEHVFQERAAAAPANRTTRMLFAQALLAENAQAPFLSRIVDPRFADEADSFTAEIERALPTLAVFMTPEISSRLDPALRRDVEELSRRYKRFLDDHALFEPGWELGQVDTRGRRYTVVYPELITDYRELEPAVVGHPAVEPVSPADTVGTELHEYHTSRVEIRDVCNRIETLLDGGVAAADIAVTVCGNDAFLSYFEDECRRLDIPTSPRAGKPLTSYPAGRFFEKLRALSASDFAIEDMRALLLDGAVPWRDPGGLRRLIRAGIAGGCRRNYREDGREQDVWLAALSGDARTGERRLYRRLRSAAKALSATRSFEELYGALYEFFGSFLDTNAWSEEQLAVFQRCLDVLSELADTSAELALSVPRPFDVWLTALRDRIYVSRERSPGVVLFPYRVAAGIEPEYHFVMNASNAAVRMVYTPHRFLRDDEKEELDLEDRDLSEHYVSVYVHSGRSVFVSYARESFSGPALPPAYFAERGLIRPVASGGAASSPYNRERAYFAGSEAGGADGAAPAPQRVYGAQLEGLSYALATAFRERRPDWSQEGGPTGADLEVLVARRRTEEGLLKVSPSDVQSYEHCPFGYLLSGFLGLEQGEYDLVGRQALDAGTAYHRAFERLYRRIREQSTVFRNADIETYRGWVSDIAAEVMEGSAVAALSLSPAETVGLRMRLEESMHNLLREDAERFDGYLIDVLERYEYVELEGGVQLGGKMDRRMLRPDGEGAVVIDYKKGKLPTKKELRVAAADAAGEAGRDATTEPWAEAASGHVAAPQLPLYAEILLALGHSVSGLYYYSVEHEKYMTVFDEAGGGILDEGTLAASRRAASAAVQRTVDGIRDGNFRFPDPREGCDACSFPGICRSRFRIK